MKKYYYANEIYHHGIKGQKWGQRRYQNPDGSLTEAGKKRYYMTKDEYDKKIASYTKKRNIYRIAAGVGGALTGIGGAGTLLLGTVKKTQGNILNNRQNVVGKVSGGMSDRFNEYSKQFDRELNELEKSKDKYSTEAYNARKENLMAAKAGFESSNDTLNNITSSISGSNGISDGFTKIQRGVKIASISTGIASAGAAIAATHYDKKIKDLEANWVEKKE